MKDVNKLWSTTLQRGVFLSINNNSRNVKQHWRHLSLRCRSVRTITRDTLMYNVLHCVHNNHIV